MYLTDNLGNPTKWQIPAGYPAQTMVPAGGFLVIWADEDTQDGPLHADFKLSAGGEHIGLFDADGATPIDTVIFGEQTANIAYGRYPDASDNWRFFPTPTPGAVNDGAYLGQIDEVEFSHARGFYDVSFNLTMATATPGVNIYYTTDGKAPIEGEAAAAGAVLYTAPVAVSSSTSVRAAAIKTGWMPTTIDTHTYIFNASNAVKAMPVVCLTGDENKTFFLPDGIMAYPLLRGRDYERPVSFEIIDLQSGASLQENCGIRIHGSDHTRPSYTIGEDWSTCWNWWPNNNSNKLGFNLWFRNAYGNSRLKHPFFPFIGVDRFKSIVLRQGKNDPCTPFVKDEWVRRLFLEMGRTQLTGTFASLYLNGEYKSYYNPTARGDEEFYQEWYGSDNAFDVITQSGVRDGDAVAWNSLLSYADSHDLSNAGDYAYVAGKLDIPTFIDYLILQIHIANFDWPNNNWDVHRERTEDGIFRFGVWDAEGVAETWVVENNWGINAFDSMPSYDPQGLNRGPWPICRLYRALKASPEFRQLFADHVHRHYRNGGIMTTSHLLARWWEVFAEISSVLPETQNHPVRFVPDEFLPRRESLMLAAFESNGLFNLSLEAPSFNINGVYRHGGYISSSDALTMTHPNSGGTIYYTTNGTDPRQSPSEGQAGEEILFAAENAAKQVLVPTGPIRAPNGTVRAEIWTGIEGVAVSDLTNKPNYPATPNKTEFWNSFQMPVINWSDMYGTRVRGLLYPPTTGSYRFWIASDDNSQLWLSTNTTPANAVKIAQVSSWTNQNEWGQYTEQQSTLRTLQAGSVYYIEALQKEHGGGDNLSVAWSGPGISGPVVIAGQYLSSPDAIWTGPGYAATGWINGSGAVGYERNPGDPVNYSSYISSGTNVNTQMYNINTSCYIRIPFEYSGQALDRLILRIRYDDGFVAFINGLEAARDRVNTTAPLDWNTNAVTGRADSAVLTPTDFDISAMIPQLRTGTNILAIQGLNDSKTSSDFLITASLMGQMQPAGMPSDDAMIYDGPITLPHSTDVKARVYTGLEWSALNEAVYEIGNLTDKLRITEIMYHPIVAEAEYVELKNISSGPINLNCVKFTRGIAFTFGSETLAAGDTVLVVRDLDVFEATYGPGRHVAGQYSGALDNSGERIRLEDARGNAILDFSYKDGWRSITDGDGYSLTFINPAASAPHSWQHKDSWRASAYVNGSPGWDDSGIIPDPGAIVINEVLAHSNDEAPDWIELYNTTAAPIDISGWYLSDSQSSLMKYRFAAGTVIAGQGYLVVTETANFGSSASDPGRLVPFALSENGERVCLTSGLDAHDALTGYRQSEDFGASERGVTFGRYYKSSTDMYNFVPMDSMTPGQPNAYPRVGPVVISEIMYHPDWPSGGSYVNNDYEYVELYNPGGSAVTLYDSGVNEPWKFTSGIDYTFPGPPNAVSIPAGGTILVVKNPTAFQWRYPSVPAGILYGPYGGRLANEGEQLELGKPGDVNNLGERQYIRVERVTYSDGSHPGQDPAEPDLWPAEADGGGKSLGRINPALYGNDPDNWQAITPGPGL